MFKSQKGRAHAEFSQIIWESLCKKKNQKSNQQYCTVRAKNTHSAHNGLHTPAIIFQTLLQSQQIHFLKQNSFSYGKPAVSPLRLNLSEQPHNTKKKREKNQNNNKKKIRKEKTSQKRNIGVYETVFQNSGGERKTT